MRAPGTHRDELPARIPRIGHRRHHTICQLPKTFPTYHRPAKPLPAAELLRVVDLVDSERALVRILSGVQRRRLDLALALTGDPGLIFLDEPATGFDLEARHRCWDAIEYLRDLGKTVFLATHCLDEAEHLADTVAILDSGRIRALRPLSPSCLVVTRRDWDDCRYRAVAARTKPRGRLRGCSQPRPWPGGWTRTQSTKQARPGPRPADPIGCRCRSRECPLPQTPRPLSASPRIRASPRHSRCRRQRHSARRAIGRRSTISAMEHWTRRTPGRQPSDVTALCRPAPSDEHSKRPCSLRRPQPKTMQPVLHSEPLPTPEGRPAQGARNRPPPTTTQRVAPTTGSRHPGN